MHGSRKATEAVTLLRLFVPRPQGNIDVKRAVEGCVRGFRRIGSSWILQVLEDETGGLLAIAEAEGGC